MTTGSEQELAFHFRCEVVVSLAANVQHQIDARFNGPESLTLHTYLPFDRFRSFIHHLLDARQNRLVIDGGKILVRILENMNISIWKVKSR